MNVRLLTIINLVHDIFFFFFLKNNKEKITLQIIGKEIMKNKLI